jgi:hypothetical protein
MARDYGPRGGSPKGPKREVAMMKILLLLPLFFLSCRGGVSFNPDFYVGDHTSQTIVSERGEGIPTADPRFDEYACMHKEKIKELKALLIRLKVPPSKVQKEYRKLVDRMTQQ